MKLPSPREGWRVFAGEVGVIVLGVLLALGAQQVVEDWQTRQDVRALRETVDKEIAYNLWIYEARDWQTACTAARLEQLSRLLDRAADGAPVALSDTRRPHSFSEYRAAWDNRDADTFAALPDQVRQKYAEFYDELDNNVANRRREIEDWEKLIPYEVKAPLTTADRRVLHQVLKLALARNQRIHENLAVSFVIGRDLGIKPIMPSTMLPEDRARAKACPTLVEEKAR